MGRQRAAVARRPLDRSRSHLGAGVDYRFPTLYAAGGARAILDESEKMGGDYARGVYLRRLVDTQRLTDAEYQRVVDVASRLMSSDYEMSRLLRSVAEHTSLDNEAMRNSYISGRWPHVVRLRALARASDDFRQDDDLARFGARRGESGGSFSSDYERSRVLLAAIESKALAIDDVIPVLETVTQTRSDYEKARVLLAVAERWTLSGDARKLYLRAADTIRSDYENRRVLSALVRQEAR
jgi:hypothetical protein